MRDQRQGTDVNIKWAIVANDAPFNLEGKDVKVYLKNIYRKTEVKDFSVEGNKLLWTFYGKDQKHTGKYSLELVINEGEVGMATTDKCDFINLVDCSCKIVNKTDDSNVEIDTIELTSTIEYGTQSVSIEVDSELSATSENPVQNKVITTKLTELSAEVEKLPTKEYVDEAIKNIPQGGGGTNEEMQRILAGNSPNLIWEDLEGKLHFEGGYITSRKAQSDTYFRTNCKKILSCTVDPTTAEWAFLFGTQSNKGVIEEVYPYIFNSAKLTSLNFAFSGAPNIKDWSFLKHFDTSKITSMSGVFHASEADTIDLSNWDVSNATSLGNNTSYSFFGNIKKVIGLENWDTSNAQQMMRLLSGVIEDYSGVKNWDVQNCSSFDSILFNISATDVDVSLWQIRDGADMDDFIRNGSSLVSFGMPNIPTGATTSNFGRYLTSLQNITMRTDALIYASLYFNESPLTADSVKTLLSHLADTPDEGATITFKSGLYTGYSAEDKAEIDALRNTATTNGWTIVNMG